VSGYRNQGFMDGLLRGWGFVSDLQQREKDNEYRQQEFGLRRDAAGREEARFDQEKAGWLPTEKVGELANLGYEDTKGQYGLGAQRRAVEAAGMQTPQQAAQLRDAGVSDTLAGFDFNAKQRPLVLDGLQYQKEARQPVAQVQEGYGLDLEGKRLGNKKTRAEIDYTNRKGTGTASGMSFSIGPDGTITYSNDGGLAKPTVNKLEETIVNSQAGLDRLRGIQRSFDPKYLKLQTQASAGLAGFKDKLGMSNENDKKLLGQYEGFRSKTLNNLNLYIKEITGAAMSEAEAGRIQSVMPSLKDGPTAFKTKMDAVMNELSRAQARAYYTRRNGLDLGSIPLASMDAIIDDFGEKVEQQIIQQNPGIDPKEAEKVAHEQVKRAFGM